MKNPNKQISRKEDAKRIKKPPVFKKVKQSGKIALPKEIIIDENIVNKTKFKKTASKNGKQDKQKNPKSGVKQKDAQSTPEVVQQTKTAKKSKKLQVTKVEGSHLSQSLLQKSKKILPTQYITDDIATKAVAALQKLDEQGKKKYKMFEEESNVFAQINCIKIQSKKTTIKVNLAHSTVASTQEVCLITTDLKKGRKHDHEPSVDYWEEVLRKAGVTEVKTVIPLRQVRVEYDQFELKRRLLTQYDMILVDSRIHSHVCHILGKVFMKKHSMLIPVRLHDVAHVKKNIQHALNISLLHISEGPTSSVTIGHMGMSSKQLKENILSLVKQLSQKFPGGEHNIRSIGIKLPLSLILPLYLTLRSKKSVNPPKIRSQLPGEHMDVEGELSTYPGRVVKVSPGGSISIKTNIAESISDVEEEELSDVKDDEEISKPKNKKPKPQATTEHKYQSLDTTDILSNEKNEGSELSHDEDDKDKSSKPKKKKQKTGRTAQNKGQWLKKTHVSDDEIKGFDENASNNEEVESDITENEVDESDNSGIKSGNEENSYSE